MAEVICMGDILVEIMRPEAGIPLNQEGYFRGPFPSGAPAIFIDTVAKMATACGALNCAVFGPLEGKISPDTVWNMIHKNEKGK